MKALFSALFLLVNFIRLSAQQEHFVFIQESNKQPFYVRVGEESQSSSASGHIILAPIKDSVYSFFIGFPKARYAEQPFTIPVRRDVGFELKRVEGVWQLIDLQSQQVIRPNINNVQVAKDSPNVATVTDSVAAKPGDQAVVRQTRAKRDSSVNRDPRDIIRFSTENVVDGKLIIYHDRSDVVTDTIRIIIPRL
jgi:hypothetical protein